MKELLRSTWLIAILLLLGCIGAASGQPEATPRPRCDPGFVAKTPPPASSFPKLLVGAQGVQYLGPGQRTLESFTSLDDLRKVLLELPASAWPAGCWVDVGEPGIRGANDEPVIDRNFRGLEEMLNGLGVKIRSIVSA